MLYGGFREVSKFWQFSSNFFVEFFKNHVKHQKMIQTYTSDVKFPAEHNPVVRKNKKNRGKLENLKPLVYLEKFITQKPTLIKGTIGRIEAH